MPSGRSLKLISVERSRAQSLVPFLLFATGRMGEDALTRPSACVACTETLLATPVDLAVIRRLLTPSQLRGKLSKVIGEPLLIKRTVDPFAYSSAFNFPDWSALASRVILSVYWLITLATSTPKRSQLHT